MNRDEFIKKVDEKLKLIRNEKGFTQDKMSEIIGISKKTLVQIEKGRSSIGWTGAIAICTIFQDSEVLQMTFGGEIEELILSLAFDNYEKNYQSTLGGRVWWRDVETMDKYTIQQNIITNHYRILDSKDRRICSSFEFDYIKRRFGELCYKKGKMV